MSPMVSGVVDSSDPNHPTEVYFGKPEFDNLADMTSDLGIRIYNEDKVKLFPDPSLNLGSQITIQRALPITVEDAGKISITRTWSTQIKDFLSEQKIVLGDQDKISPDLTTWLRSDLRITITRVDETELKEEETVVSAKKEKGKKK